MPSPQYWIDQLCALVNGHTEKHPEGVYALRYAGQYENVGTDAEAALCAFERKKKLLEVKAAGVEVVEHGLPTSVKNKLDEVLEAIKRAEKPKRNFKEKANEYLKEIRQDKKNETYDCYRITVEGFFAVRIFQPDTHPRIARKPPFPSRTT